ncbi:hypothetical protein SAY87_020689 [Trapa incisa]|uniref:Uncharacterized protein n=2 Tax=Trapa TaxID=22665 RepID=A0AAN7ME29_TRANT|nr:hypothetical protein SAY87_020689 [Trapa incisa]KAK4803562.1 hypothetical protein SAY86_003379 [Trapa natans]
MNEFIPQRSKPWSVYSSPPQVGLGLETEAPWKSLGASINAISFGFLATALLISMFLIMAIFEHLFRPIHSFHPPESAANGASTLPQKIVNQHPASSTSYPSDFSVLMPGENQPTYIAQPAPFPCQREGINWPSHGHT